MGITVVLAKRSGQSSPLTAGQWNEVMTQIEVAFASVPSQGLGSVTSVALTVPSFLSVSGSPITSSGIFAVTLASQSANLVFSSPSSGSGTPLFRSLVANDLPTVTTAKGGTGKTTIGTAYQLLRTDATASGLDYATISAGSSKVTVTNGAGISIDIVENQISRANLIGITPIAGGGSGASTAQGARVAILPSLTGNALKSLRVNAGETDVEWAVVSGSVASVNSLVGALTINSGSSGTDLAIASAGTTITVGIPSMTTGITRGLLTGVAQIIPGAKTFSDAPIVPITDTYILYSNSGEISGNANYAVNDTLEQMELKRISVAERQIALGFNPTYKTSNYNIDADTDYIIYMDTTSGNLDIALPDTANAATKVGTIFRIVKTVAGNNLSVKAQSSDNIGAIGTTTVTFTATKSFIELQYVKSGLYSILSTGTIS